MTPQRIRFQSSPGYAPIRRGLAALALLLSALAGCMIGGVAR